MKKNIIRLAVAAALVLPLASGSMLAAPASAQIGGIVHDPRNFSQNILTAARTLEQINNQIKQLQNQAPSLLNEARNLQSLPVSTLGELQAQVDQTRQLLSQAEGIAYDVTDIRKTFEQRYKGTAFSGSTAEMGANAEARWKDSVGAFEDAMKVQAGIVSNMGGTRSSISTVVGGYKAAVTLHAHRVGLISASCSPWQGRFWDHIVRDDADMLRIRDYVRTNPARWLEDQLHPAAPPNRFNRW